METLIQQASRESDRKYRNQQGMQGPFEGLVVEVVNQEDSVGIAYGPTPNRKMPIAHPFVGGSSWIRSVPDVGSRVLMQNRFDTGQAEILKSLPLGTENSARAENYFSQQNNYRELSPGEHDLASKGFASIYMSRRGSVDQYAGSGVDRRMDRDNLDIRDSAPTQRYQFMNWIPGQMGDEKRFGIVKRWTTPIDEFFPQDGAGNFKNENYFHLKNPAGANPEILLSRIEGHVYDDTGALIKQFSTQNNLRHQTLLYTDTDDFLQYEVDVNGNSLEIFPSVATIGKEVRIPQGSYIAQIGLDRDVTIQRDEKVIVEQNIQYTVGGSVSYNVTKDINYVAGLCAFTMSNATGDETVGLVTSSTPNLLGFQAANNSSGGITSIFGPMNSAVFLNGDGKVQVQDGLGGSLTMEGTDVTLASAGGSTFQVGDTQINMMLQSGTDGFNVSPGLLQIISSAGVAINALAANLNCGNVFLGVAAVIPAVLGLSLVTYLDTHTHTGNLGLPTSPPIIPSASFIGTPLSILSTGTFLSPAI